MSTKVLIDRLSSEDPVYQNRLMNGLEFVTGTLMYSVYGMMAAGLLHSRSMKYIYHKSMSKVHGLLKNYEKAVYHQSELLAIPTSNLKTIEAKIKLSELYQKAGRDDESREELVKSTDMLFRPEEMISPVHFLSKVAMFRNPFLEARFKSLSETTNEVFVMGHKALGEMFIFKRGKSLDDFVADTKLSGEMKLVIGEREDFGVADPLKIINYDGKPMLVSSLEKGKTLFQKIEDKDEDYFYWVKKATEFIAFLHAEIPIGSVKDSSYDTQSKIYDRISRVAGARLARKIAEGAGPILTIEGVSAVYLDAHPENFIITDKGKIVFVDVENLRLEPIEVDHANLQCYCLYLSNEEEISLENYVTNLYRKNMFPVEENLVLSLLNAKVKRSLLLIEPHYSRKKRRDLARDLILNMIKSINRIKSEHGDFYNRYSSEFEMLFDGIVDLDRRLFSTLPRMPNVSRLLMRKDQ